MTIRQTITRYRIWRRLRRLTLADRCYIMAGARGLFNNNLPQVRG